MAESFLIYFLIFIKIWKVKQAVASGAELFACNHTNGLVFLVFIGMSPLPLLPLILLSSFDYPLFTLVAGGLIIRFVIGGVLILTSGLCYLYAYKHIHSFVGLGIDTLTVMIPLGFHLYNITKASSR